MFKKIIIYTLNYNIKNCFVGMKYYNLTIKGFIYKHTLCLLGLKIKWYNIKIIVPYVKRPFYDGEYNTNRKLRCYKIQMKGELKEQLLELKNK